MPNKKYSIVELCEELEINESEIFKTIEREWIVPLHGKGDVFNEEDLSRLQLILELKNDFHVNNEGIDLVLHLIDQLHSFQRILRRMQLNDSQES